MTAHLSRPSRRRRALTVLAALALSTTVTTGVATASPASGEVVFSLKPGGEKSLLRQDVKTKAGSSKRVLTRQSRGGVQIALPVVDVELREAARIQTAGTLAFSLEGRKATLRDLILQVAGSKTAISAKLGGKRLVVFRARGEAKVDSSTLALNGAKLSLTEKGARALQQRLDLEQLAAGKLGTVDVDARLTPVAKPASLANDVVNLEVPDKGPVDPYAQQCSVALKSTVPGNAADPVAAPTMTSPASVNGGSIQWGFQDSFRFYVVSLSGGTIVPIAPATQPSPPLGGFSFPATGGGYVLGAAGDPGDDVAVIDGSGEVVICNAPHGFRITLSNPTVTIDGADSRLTVDVDTNMSGIHTPAQRVDLAKLDLGDVSTFYSENAKTVTWGNLPVTITAAGAEALQLCNPMNPGPCSYEEGDTLEPLTVTAATNATEAAWPFASACNIVIPATASSWPPAPAAPLALPVLSASQSESISEGSIDWGFRNSLRNTVQTNGVFNLSGGATRSDALDMSGSGKFFSWPSTSGEYEPGIPGRLVLHGTGSVALCNTAHGFGTVLANPTLVIDGTKSRISVDVATRLGTSWTWGRVDVATIATGGIVVEELADTPSPGLETVKWTFPDLGADNAPGGGDDDTDSTNSSVKLATPGTSAFWLLGGSYKTTGTALNKLSVSFVHPAS
ncbi:MAG TPA: HtaA domain-containing protein [Solirubrobacterales bacterium]|nr:HtaA domain-containing protein [Solirubrobacterales bacterium]